MITANIRKIKVWIHIKMEEMQIIHNKMSISELAIILDILSSYFL